ncbi:uncharacterized protein LOC118509642 [Anopheles stephensi]|uniref:uncharacterized protein LOC118509642 n=1 Tax=Anopheles stephensi TaxID=30069 RepID=UPI0016588E20|nr:uncharacterized protein LOC118509642 [Anopheles stephensi]
MITKYRLSDNASLGDVSTPISGSDSTTEETTCESMNRDDQCSNDQQSNDCGRYLRSRSIQKKRLPGSLLSDDSCNAVDNMLGVTDGRLAQTEDADQNCDLSFNGKIKTLTSGSQHATLPTTKSIDGCTTDDAAVPEVPVDVESKSDLQRREEKFNESFELLTKECNTLIHYNNEKSPDLFADDDEETDVGSKNEAEKENLDYSMHRSYQRVSGTGTKELDCEGEGSVDRTDYMLLKRMKTSLSGIPPPPALTYSDIDVGTMLTIYRSNVKSWLATHGFSKNTVEKTTTDGEGEDGKDQPHQQCLMKPTHSTEELSNLQWPELTKHRAHGLHYNRSRVSENFELLGLKYIERYISAETSCSFNMTVLQSSAKKRNQRLKLLNQSPGRRLSHLARRRATFSSESLLNTSASKGGTIVSASKSAIDAGVLRRLNPHRACNNRQVLLDPKKSDNRRKNKIKTPKRRTPGGKKSPRRRTPGSSAKKLSLLRANAGGKSCTQVHVPATRESSKRALFLSPQNSDKLVSPARNDLRFSLGSNSKQTERSIFSEARILKSKRSLFSQPRGTSESNGIESIAASSHVSNSTATVSNKRRRSSTTDNNDDGVENASGERTEKIRRTESSGLTEEDLTPRSLKFARSKSFCVGLQSMGLPSATPSDGISAPGVGGKTLIRANSEISSSDGPRPLVMLTENHKKKLLWAVSQALQSKQITAKHELFKQHASNLVRVVKRLFLEFNDQTTSSTSEKLLKLANKHVYEVIQGKSVDDIYFREKTRIMNARNMPKLQGYIAAEEYELRKLKRTTSITSFDGSSPFDCSLSASQSLLSQSSMLSQGSSFGGLSQLSQTTSFVRSGANMKPAASTGSVNMVGLSNTSTTNTALRENVDSELRQRSTKKQLLFSGKDQKNVSPFRMEKNLSLIGSNVNANKLLVGGSLNSSIMKAKRQISFE